jgi:phosphate transport system substrate-binding protein
MTVEGDLISHDGELFRVETAFGPLTLDAGYMRCSGPGCPDPAELVARSEIGGPPEMIHRLLPALLEVFADLNGLSYLRRFIDDTSVAWELRQAETDRLLAVISAEVLEEGTAQERLLAGEIDFGLATGEVDTSLRQDVIALDALVPVVAPQNPRAMVTLNQLIALVNGETDDWARLGGEAARVAVHVPEGWDAVTRRLGPVDLSGAERHEDVRLLADAVADDPAALGLVPFSAIGNAVPLVVGGACGLATPATRDTIRAEDYPLTQPVFLQRSEVLQPKIVRDFIAFARSEAAQPVIRATGFVDQAIGRIAFERQGDRIANAVLSAGDDPESAAQVRDMIGQLLDAERLTITFRFRDGSSDLDPQSASNIQRLADAITRGDFSGETLMFVGFSDRSGDHDANLRLSERRARSVRRAVAARAPDSSVSLELAAFGELMPMACQDTPWGPQVNRRVEVWATPSEVTR